MEDVASAGPRLKAQVAFHLECSFAKIGAGASAFPFANPALFARQRTALQTTHLQDVCFAPDALARLEMTPPRGLETDSRALSRSLFDPAELRASARSGRVEPRCRPGSRIGLSRCRHEIRSHRKRHYLNSAVSIIGPSIRCSSSILPPM